MTIAFVSPLLVSKRTRIWAILKYLRSWKEILASYNVLRPFTISLNTSSDRRTSGSPKILTILVGYQLKQTRHLSQVSTWHFFRKRVCEPHFKCLRRILSISSTTLKTHTYQRLARVMICGMHPTMGLDLDLFQSSKHSLLILLTGNQPTIANSSKSIILFILVFAPEFKLTWSCSFFIHLCLLCFLLLSRVYYLKNLASMIEEPLICLSSKNSPISPTSC
jgi:hypothetical protein